MIPGVPQEWRLIGPPEQVAGGCYVVTNAAEAEALLAHLGEHHSPRSVYGLDVEWENWNGKTDKRSPVGRASPTHWSIAWVNLGCDLGYHPSRRLRKVPLAHRATLLWSPEVVEVFRPWLENPRVKKVGHNLTDTDYHAMVNGGVRMAGVLADTLKLSKLVSNVPYQPHGLKHHLKNTFGYVEKTINDLFSRPGAGAMNNREKVGKSKRKVKYQSDPVPTVLGTCSQNVCWGRTELIPFSVIQPGHPRWVQMVDYASLDAKACLELYYYLWPRLKAAGLDWYYERIDHPRLRVLTGMEEAGWLLDQERMAEGIRGMDAELARLERELLGWELCYIKEKEGWMPAVPNPDSDSHMHHLLYGEGWAECSNDHHILGLGLPIPPVCGTLRAVQPTQRGKKPRSEASLLWLADCPEAREYGEYIKLLSEYSKLKSLRGKMQRFKDAAAEEPDDRLRYQLKAMTDTGRLSASNQPIQQVPGVDPDSPWKGKLREAFVASPGHKLIVADFSGLEMRVLSHFLLRVFNSDELANDVLSADIHSSVAKKVWVEELAEYTAEQIKSDKKLKKAFRAPAKIVIYALNYGKTALGLGIQIQDPETGRAVGTERAQEILDQIISLYPLQDWWDYLLDVALADNYQVKTILGRPRVLPGLALDPNNRREKWQYYADERRLKNTVIQGTAADIVDMAMLKCNTFDHPDLVEADWVNWYLKDLGCVMLAQVHDELVFEVPEEHAEEALAEVTRCMEGALPLLIPTPVDAHIVDNWGEAK